jgi:hypothetical protein
MKKLVSQQSIAEVLCWLYPVRRLQTAATTISQLLEIDPSLQLAGDERGQVSGAAGVPPLIIVPGYDFDHIV